jgi:hypothetical protein
MFFITLVTQFYFVQIYDNKKIRKNNYVCLFHSTFAAANGEAACREAAAIFKKVEFICI